MYLKLRETANSKGLTLKDLSKKLKINEVTLYGYADGLKTPTLETTYRIANELGVTMEDLIMDEDRKLDQVCKMTICLDTANKVLQKIIEDMQTEGYYPDMKYESVIEEYKKKVR